MFHVSLVAAMDEHRGLGKDNHLLCHLPADLGHFKALTLGKPIIMGRKTFESIGRPLPGRLNMVLSRHDFTHEGVTTALSFEAALHQAQATNSEVMVIGGEQVFVEALPYANTVYLTKIHHVFAADVFFPQLDAADWSCEDAWFRLRDDRNAYDMTFYTYRRIA